MPVMGSHGLGDFISRQHLFVTTISDIGGRVMIENEEKTPEAQNVISKCARCKILLDHAVVSYNVKGVIDQVKCMICGSEHKYSPAKKPPKPRAKKVDPARDFELLSEKYKGKKPVSYTMTGLFKVEDVIDHNTFGMGIVIGTSFKQMEVVFSDRPRILVFNREEMESSREL
jgi:hypothetical protein